MSDKGFATELKARTGLDLPVSSRSMGMISVDSLARVADPQGHRRRAPTWPQAEQISGQIVAHAAGDPDRGRPAQPAGRAAHPGPGRSRSLSTADQGEGVRPVVHRAPRRRGARVRRLPSWSRPSASTASRSSARPATWATPSTCRCWPASRRSATGATPTPRTPCWACWPPSSGSACAGPIHRLVVVGPDSDLERSKLDPGPGLRHRPQLRPAGGPHRRRSRARLAHQAHRCVRRAGPGRVPHRRAAGRPDAAAPRERPHPGAAQRHGAAVGDDPDHAGRPQPGRQPPAHALQPPPGARRRCRAATSWSSTARRSRARCPAPSCCPWPTPRSWSSPRAPRPSATPVSPATRCGAYTTNPVGAVVLKK